MLLKEATIYVNFACNLGCATCYQHGIGVSGVAPVRFRTPENAAMPFSLFAITVDQMLGMNPGVAVFLMGGEPFLHPDLAHMVRFFRSRSGGYIDVNTNGTLLIRRGDEILDSGITAIYVSLDGPTAEVNDAVRGTGSFQRAVDGIRHVLRLRNQFHYSTKISLTMTITRYSYNVLSTMGKLAEELGVDELFVNFPVFVSEDQGRSSAQALKPILGAEFCSWSGFMIQPVIRGIDPAVLLHELSLLLEAKHSFAVQYAPVGFSPRTLATTYFDDESWSRSTAGLRCPKLQFRTTILPDGKVSPCTVFTDLVVGSLHESSLQQIWEGDVYNRFRSLLSERHLGICSRCCDMFDESGKDGDTYARTPSP